VNKFGNALNYVNKNAAMWTEKDFVLAMVQLNGYALAFAADGFRADKEVVLAAVTQESGALQYADKNAAMWVTWSTMAMLITDPEGISCVFPVGVAAFPAAAGDRLRCT